MGLSKSVKTSVLCLSLSLFASSSGFGASLRGDSRDVFSAPPAGGWTQILLGLVELGVAQAVWPKMTEEQEFVQAAQRSLVDAESTPTSQAEKDALIKRLEEKVNTGGVSITVGKATQDKEALESLLERAKNFDIVDAAEKTKRISAAQQSYANAVELALKGAQSKGFVHGGLRILRAGTSIVLTGDVLARIYIWNVLDANPTFSPLASLSIQGLQNVLGK